jgi:selenocysteine lyase/cysteine desulfurase
MAEPDAGTYLDYASTAAIRPPAVTRAIVDYLDTNGATPGRGGHRRAIAADRFALHCRQLLGRLLDIPGDPGRITFFPNATYALNTALRGVLHAGDRVVVTTFDHNAVLRPVYAMADSQDTDVRLVPGDASGALDTDAFDSAIDGACLVVLNAVSNVLGTALDLPVLVQRAHDAGALVLVDAAQAAGEIAFSVQDCDADLVAFTGHKGLLGPPGTGALWVRENVDIDATIRGGTGGDSLDRAMPAAYPDHLEAGSQNGLGIAGLAAGVQWLLDNDMPAIQRRVLELAERLVSGLTEINGVRVLSPAKPAVPIVTFTADAMDPSTLAMQLDREFGVLARAGLHCAPEVHRMLGTDRTGAVRFSAGWATTPADIDRAVQAVHTLLAKPVFATGAP